MSRTLVPLLAIAFAAAACKEKAPEKKPELVQAGGNQAGIVGQPVPKDPDWQYLVVVTALRKEPSDAKQVDDPSGKKVNNWVATLQRGEKVSVEERKDDWVKVKASDESVGWVKKSVLLSTKEGSEAATLEDLDTFERPDLGAIRPGKKIPAGTLVFAIRLKDPFREVNATGWGTLWVMNDKVSLSPSEATVARLIERARVLRRDKKGEGAADLVNLAKSQFPDSKLLSILEEVASGKAPALAATATAADERPPE